MFNRQRVLIVGFVCLSQWLLQGCAHKKPSDHLSLKELQGKRVAMVEVRGPAEAKALVEVAVLNEILEHGRFEIIDKPTVQGALVAYPDDSDWQRLGKKVGADYVLAVGVSEFKVDERKGHDRIDEEDSVLAEEAGEPRKKTIGTRYVKVKSDTGLVRLELRFFDVEQGKVILSGTGESSETHSSRDPDAPRKLALLERLTQKAVANFFESQLRE